MSRTARIRSTAECEFCDWGETLTEVVDEEQSSVLRTAANLEAEAEVRLREHLSGCAKNKRDKAAF